MKGIHKKGYMIGVIVCLTMLNISICLAQNLGIPQYPGSELKKEYTREGVLFTEFLITTEKTDFLGLSGEGTKVAEDYLKILQKTGWKLKKETWRKNGADFVLEKDITKHLRVDVGTVIKGSKHGKGGYIFIKSELSSLIPLRDAIGIDPPDVPRYPGSVRVRWMNIIGEWSGKYKTLEPAKKVEEFFKQELPKYGWRLTREKGGKLSFEKGGVKSAEELPKESRDPTMPLQMIKKMIPTTLNLMISEAKGITDIGFGRSAGSSDVKESRAPTAGFTYEPKSRVYKNKVITNVDIDKDIPIYPGAQKKDIKRQLFILKAPEVINIKYETSQDALLKQGMDISTFYTKNMPQRGWLLEDEDIWGIGSVMSFRKGAVEARVKIRDTGIRFLEAEVAAKAPTKVFPVEIEISLPIPSRDIAGEDIADVTRFPGSKRFYYLKAGIDHVVKYKAIGSKDEVYAFYIKELPEKGWVMCGADQDGITFTPASSPKSGVEAFSSGEWIPTTLVIKVKDEGNGVVDIGIDLTRGS